LGASAPAGGYLRPAVDIRGRAYARFLAEIDGRLESLSLELRRLSKELAAAERLLEREARPVESIAKPAVVEVPTEVQAHLLFVPRPSGYSLLAQPGPLPTPGAHVDLPDLGGSYVVAKLGPAPLPGDGRRCAYLLG
jgi:hypothetical protein